MAELIHTFTGGKMNKDLDERLVPNGQYRDALNISISSSEGSDTGAIENIKGNFELKNKSFNASTNTYNQWSSDYIDSLSNPVCIGSIADNVDEKVYWFIASDTASVVAEYDKNTSIIKPIIVDTQGVLNFSEDYLITGINIIEDLLFWTDNQEEPKSINIKNWKDSTPNFLTHSQIYGRDFVESDVVVIKPGPLTAPSLTLSDNLGTGSTTTSAVYNFTDNVTSGAIGASVEPGTSLAINLGSPINANAGDILSFTCDLDSSEGYAPIDSDGEPDIYSFIISVVSITNGGTVLNGVLQSGTAELVSGSFTYQVDIQGSKILFELKFPRFGYRYKYTDNQYSPFSPFSEVAFLPSSFEYNAKNGWNKGMINGVKRIVLGGFDSPLPKGVEELDILYKQDGVNAIYKVESLSPEDLNINYIDHKITNNSANSVNFTFLNTKNESQTITVFATQTINIIAKDNSLTPSSATGVDIVNTSLGTVFEVISELIYSLLPSNQILRPWDNVPRKAKSQEAISNRIIYGNYLQNYNVSSSLKFDSVNTLIDPNPILNVGEPYKSIKSIRTYQIGVVFKDKYGRETPVFTDPSGVLDLTNELSDAANSIKVKLSSYSPKNPDGTEMFETFKFFIKDPSAFYYNVVADRLYESEDGESVWISMPSAETNKVQEGDFLILKKQNDSSLAVKNYPQNKFKVLTKKPEAPLELRKTKRVESSKDYSFDIQFGSGTQAEWKIPGATPVPGYSTFLINNESGNSGVSDATLAFWQTSKYVRFSSGTNQSQFYEITNVETDQTGSHTELKVNISPPFTTDINFLYTDPTIPNSALVSIENRIEIAEDFQALGKGQYEGRFFVRLEKSNYLMNNFTPNQEYIPASTTIVRLDFSSDRYQIFSGGGGPLQNAAGTQIGSNTRLYIDTNRNLGGMQTQYPNDTGAFGSLCQIPYDSCEAWDFVFERKLTSVGSAEFGNAFNVGAKIRFSTHPTVYEILYIHEFEQTSGSTYVRSYVRLDKPLEASISPWQINQASGGNSVFVDGVEIYNGIGEPSVTIDILKQVDSGEISSINPAIFETEPAEQAELDIYYEISNALPIAQYNNQHTSPWFNCYSFGNGVESNRIRDDFNAPYISAGTKANAVLDTPYEEEYLRNNLIFSGIFNSISGLNELNQFIQAEAITKSLDPQSGPIQKLFARETDLLAFCEDKVVKILADKDAIYNADGNSQLTAANRVLGQAIIPSSFGMFGIGKNPESFANYGYRVYFTDNAKGKVLRLSMDGVTPISNYGLDDFFQDNLPLNNKILGCYNNDNGTYNLTLNSLANEWSDKYGLKTTLSFSESINGWSSRKSYIPENGISIDTKFYTFKGGLIYEHGKNDLYNNFYGVQYQSTLTLISNENPLSVKGFKTINYTGTAAKSNVYSISSGVYNGINYSISEIETIKSNGGPNPTSVISTPGWWVSSTKTNLQSGTIPEFINKEGKYYNNIKGDATTVDNIDTTEFSVQGIGKPTTITGDVNVTQFKVRIFADPSCFTNNQP